MSITARTDVYARITSSILAAIEAGAKDFKMPWRTLGPGVSRPANVVTGRPYRGVNVVALWAASQALEAPTGAWGTFRQWQALGASVRKGEHGTTVVLWKDLPTQSNEGAEPSEDRRRFLARGFCVFNQSQTEGYVAPVVPTLSEEARIARAEAFWTQLAIKTVYGGQEAFYAPSRDQVHLPPFSVFLEPSGAYSVQFHEGVHATGAPHRCDRDLKGRFGGEAYAMEELVAELGAAMILADLEISDVPRPDHSAYIASWLKVLKSDASAIFTAASKAQAAADWMHAQQPRLAEPDPG
jgi:antirestriction protein ArdC